MQVMDVSTTPEADPAAAAASLTSMPFNPSNSLLQEDDLRRLVLEYHPDIVGSGVNDINLYRKAMTHRSYCTRKNENFIEGNARCPASCIPLQEESNERLEFLGDAVLNLVVGAYLYERFPDDNEGFLTRMRTKLVNGGMLAQLCGLCGLANWIIISRQIDENNGRCNKKILEDTFEAFLGALYIDHGFVAARQWLVNFIEQNVDFTELIRQHANYKDTLSKYFQHAFNCLPRFSEVASSGGGGGHSGSTNSGPQCHQQQQQQQQQTYTTVCVRNREGVIVGTGRAQTKKAAENEAARRALQYYGQLSHIDGSSSSIAVNYR
jgi:ribonuclease III